MEAETVIHRRWRTVIGTNVLLLDGLLEKLETIAERITRIEAAVPGEEVVGDGLDPGVRESLLQGIEFIDEQAGVGLGGRPEGFFNAQVQFDAIELDPQASAGIQSRRFRNLGESKEIEPELTGFRLPIGRYGELHMVVSHNRSVSCIAPATGRFTAAPPPRHERYSRKRRTLESDMFDLTGHAEFSKPTLLMSFDGWVDAASVGTTCAEGLAEDGTLVATFDTDLFLDYRASRPTADFVDGRLEEVDWPAITVTHARHGGDDLLVMTGSEPDMRWRQLGDAISKLVREWEVRQLVCIGSVPSALPHTMPTPIMNTSTHLEMEKLGESVASGLLRVPAAFVTAVEHRLGQEGLPTFGFWAQVPHYVNAPFWQGVVALRNRLGRHLGVALDDEELIGWADEQIIELDQIAEAQPQVRAHLERLQALAGQEPLPSGEELATEIEQYLENQGDE